MRGRVCSLGSSSGAKIPKEEKEKFETLYITYYYNYIHILGKYKVKVSNMLSVSLMYTLT